ncbi:MAG: hypothetical protein IKP06_07680 [Elusimicrobiaceae bacterium]|nr:hypothetical protein [Elusimicrobiaceae bacterium]
MSKRMYTEEKIQDIAIAIREKTKKTDKYNIEEMAAAIRNDLSRGLDSTKLIINSSEYTTNS